MNKGQDRTFELIRMLVSVGIALGLAFVVILLISKEPANALRQFLIMPAATLRNFGNVIELSIPFIFTGLSVCVMYQAHQFTMISEGSFFFGGLVATVFVLNVALPAGIHPIAAILVGGLAGSLGGLLTGVFKAKWGANEFVMSLMLNYVMLYTGVFILSRYLRDPKKGSLASYAFPESAKLPIIVPGTRIHAGLLVAIVMIVLTYLFLYRTRWGYAIRMTGMNQNFAAYAGISTTAVIIYSQVIGGFLAGMGGATEMTGMYVRFQWKGLPGYGFDGIMVATLAQLNPALVPVAALLLAYIRIGADIMARNSDVPSEVVAVIQAIIIILVAASGFLAKWKHKRTLQRSGQQVLAGGKAV